MKRRSFLMGTAAAAAAASTRATAAAVPHFLDDVPFSLRDLEQRAAALAAEPYRIRPEVPAAWRDLSYEQYRSIWFNPTRAVWAGEDTALQLDMFHPGLYFPRAVGVNIVENGRARRVAFDFALFDHTDQVPDLPFDETMGYSGIRLRTELAQPDIFQEFAVFQGASYFRMVARDQVYGLSARGLALRTADPGGEEFPEFIEFWVERAAPEARRFTLHALLDSPSVAGLYTFEIEPGDQTRVDVRAVLHPRVTLDHVGLGPLTSMFMFDQTNRNRFDDFRTAVHDSDGLMIHNGAGEQIWRPLANPTRLQISNFVDENPLGFGLSQRARTLSDFADLEAHYHKRPSLWIEPEGDWGKGAVALVEIPTDREIFDNIVAYWQPQAPLPAGRPHRFAYAMVWCDTVPERKPVARVLNTYMGKGFTDSRVAAIDFAPHPALPEDLEALVRHVSTNRGTVSDGVLQRNPETGGVRLAFSFDPGTATSMELRAQLMLEGRAVSEVWMYRWTDTA